jgi:hypothetical protein
LSQHEDAIRELIRYLVSYPAEFYRDTLAELLHSLDESYMAMYAEDIRRIARKNGIEM